MFFSFRLYAYSNNEDEAKFIFESIINKVENSIVSKEYENIEPYWKIEGMYTLDAKIEFDKSFDSKKSEEFFESISDKWTISGEFEEMRIASETTEGCNYIKKGVSMLTICY